MVKNGVYHQYLALMNYFLNKSVISKTYATKHGFDNRNSENFYIVYLHPYLQSGIFRNRELLLSV